MEENTTLTSPAVSAHDDFDWSVDKRNVSRYNNEEQLKYDAVYEGTFKQITDGEMVQGTVVGMVAPGVMCHGRTSRCRPSPARRASNRALRFGATTKCQRTGAPNRRPEFALGADR